MKVTINTEDGDFRLSHDGLQYVLAEVNVIQDENSPNYGKETERNQRYLPSIEAAAKRIVTHQLKSCNAETLQELLEEFTRKTDILVENIKAIVEEEE